MIIKSTPNNTFKFSWLSFSTTLEAIAAPKELLMIRNIASTKSTFWFIVIWRKREINEIKVILKREVPITDIVVMPKR